ncbi:hypothetical protein ZWY2020_020919 [Hordeum vulgare]|nr:hypothetical protein ZWY2020_020919 [Hordeum vulgare]
MTTSCANFFGLHKSEHVEIPDGTRKKLSESQQMDERRDWKRQLVQTLVDKYNDHHHLSGDLAYELKNVVCLESVAGGNGQLEFTWPRGRGKKLQEEWAVPLRSVQDINEENLKAAHGLS